MYAPDKTNQIEKSSVLQILILEDNLNLAKKIMTILNKQGYNIDRNGTLSGILKAVKKQKYHLLIADIHVSNMDDLKIIKQVKEINPEIEIIVMISHATSAIAKEAMALGASDLLPKPFTEGQIKKIVDKVFNTNLTKTGQADTSLDSNAKKLSEKREILRAMAMISKDTGFWDTIMEKGIAALWQYDLSLEAKVAITSGNLQWLNKNLGELTQKQLLYIRNCQNVIYQKFATHFLA